MDIAGHTVLCFGASGAVGRFLVPRLCAAGMAPVAVTRGAPPPDAHGVRWLCGDLENASFGTTVCDAVVSAGPLDRFVDWLERADLAGVRHVVALSSMSAASKRESADAVERELAARLAACEARLAQRCDALGVAWTVLRPTLIYGAAVDRSLTPIARFARRTRLFPWIPFARGLRQPVHADDLAAACVASLVASDAAGRRFELGGAERLAFGAMLARVRAGLGFATLPLLIPVTVMRVASFVSGRGRGMVQRCNADLVADNTAAEAVLGYRPRPFRPGPECWFGASGNAAPRI